jgi:hypothetical protein
LRREENDDDDDVEEEKEEEEEDEEVDENHENFYMNGGESDIGDSMTIQEGILLLLGVAIVIYAIYTASQLNEKHDNIPLVSSSTPTPTTTTTSTTTDSSTTSKTGLTDDEMQQ